MNRAALLFVFSLLAPAALAQTLTGSTFINGFNTLRLTGPVSGTGPLTLSGGVGGTIFSVANTFTGGITRC